MRINVDLAAYRSNVQILQSLLAPSQLMAVVKDDAYGHGLDRIVPAAIAAGIRSFAVLDIPTGVHVRGLVADPEVQLFAWLFGPQADFNLAVESKIDLGVSSLEVLEAIAKQVNEHPARVHLKIDTGLHRNGASPESWPRLVQRAMELQDNNLIVVQGIWTHIGEASDEEDSKSQAIFEEAISEAASQGLSFSQRHLAASAASYSRPEFRYDLCRVGGFTYGVAPGDGVNPSQLGLLPVMTVTAEVVGHVEIDGPGTVRIDVGFVDGLPDWSLSPSGLTRLPREGFEVLYRGSRLPIVRVEASFTVLDCSHEPDLAAGDEVVLFGSHERGEPVLQEWADALGTVGEELVVRLGQLNERTYC